MRVFSSGEFYTSSLIKFTHQIYGTDYLWALKLAVTFFYNFGLSNYHFGLLSLFDAVGDYEDVWKFLVGVFKSF